MLCPIANFKMALGTTHTAGNYFSIEDILATQERIPCKCAVVFYGLGFLDPSADEVNLGVGTSLELPLWLSQVLCTRGKKFVTIDVPKPYREAYRDILQADSSVVNLERLSPHYFEFGSYLSTFDHPDTTQLKSLLSEVFCIRFRRVLDWSQNASRPPPGLDRLETGLLTSGQKAHQDLMNWLSENERAIKAANLVMTHRKRKLVETGDV